MIFNQNRLPGGSAGQIGEMGRSNARRAEDSCYATGLGSRFLDLNTRTGS